LPRIVGIDIPKEKHIGAALRYIYGIGASNALQILNKAGIDPHKKAKELSEEEVSKIATIIQKEYRVEGDLKREISQNIKRLMDISAYRGLRHRRSLPVHGQRTRTNARTRKGPRKNVAIMRLAAAPAKPAAAPAAKSK
jgi:small subunit ribosomal protein S13